MAFTSSPITYLVSLLLLISISSFTTGTAASRASKTEPASKPQLFHAVTGNVSVFTSANGVLSSDRASTEQETFSFYCRSKRDCAFAGPNATCWNYQCICDLGYLSINAYCRKLNCSSNSDCRRHFYNSRCNTWNRSCVCDIGTHLDRYSQTCLFNSGDHLALKISLPLSIFFVAILVACCCCCCCKRRRRREQQARLLANPADPNGPLYQAVGPTNGTSYQGAYQNPSLIYPSLNQAPPPYNPAYTGGSSSTVGWNLPPTSKS